MADYDNTNRGALFINDRKKTSKHPDYNGKLDVNGTEYWFSGWVKTINSGKNKGKQFISVSLGDPVEPEAAAPATGFPGVNTPSSNAPARDSDSSEAEGFDSFDDDVPF